MFIRHIQVDLEPRPLSHTGKGRSWFIYYTYHLKLIHDSNDLLHLSQIYDFYLEIAILASSFGFNFNLSWNNSTRKDKIDHIVLVRLSFQIVDAKMVHRTRTIITKIDESLFWALPILSKYSIMLSYCSALIYILISGSTFKGSVIDQLLTTILQYSMKPTQGKAYLFNITASVDRISAYT